MPRNGANRCILAGRSAFRRGRGVTSPNTRVLRRFAWLAWLAPLFLGGLTFGQNGALRVTEPPPSKNAAIFTSEPAIPLQGTLSWAGGDMRVLWQSNRGFSDLAAVTVAEDGRTVLWNAASPVPLRPGINHVRIMALGQPGAATFVNVYYTPKATAAGPNRNGYPPGKTDRLRGDRRTGGLSGRYHPGQVRGRGRGPIQRPLRREKPPGSAPAVGNHCAQSLIVQPDCGR